VVDRVDGDAGLTWQKFCCPVVIKIFFMAKYSPKAQDKVEKSMHEMKEGELRSGRSNKKVTNPKQAIAIGLSEARKEGAKVPKKAAIKKKTTSRSK
jgi:hypothetical protein